MTPIRRALAFSVLLTLVSAFAWAPAAHAVAYCDSGYCEGKPSTTKCGCPPYTDRPGAAATCGSWNQVGVCWYGLAAAVTEELACPAVSGLEEEILTPAGR